MIEHFKKFDDGGKSLLPLSFSHLNEFAFYRERWALRRIFGYEFPTGASAVRGNAVESGLNMILDGMSFKDASEIAKLLKIGETTDAYAIGDIEPISLGAYIIEPG